MSHAARIVVALAVAVMVGAPATQAQTFKGKTVTILIGPGAAGSGYDLYGRLVARYLGRHLPGEPTIVAQNMSGGAGLVLANHLQAAAPRDGSTLGVIADIAPLTEMLDSPGARYKSAGFNWIGRIDASPNLTITWRTSQVKTLDDARRIPATIAVGPVGGLAHQMPALLNARFGTKFDLVQGYPSTAAMQQAMLRGETEGASADFGALRTTHPEWLADRSVNILVQYAPTRAAGLPDTPAAGELARTDAERQLLALALSPADIGRPLVAPPGTPPDVVAALRAGFDAAMADPQLIADAARARLPLDPMQGEKLQAIVARLAATPADVVADARAALAPK